MDVILSPVERSQVSDLQPYSISSDTERPVIGSYEEMVKRVPSEDLEKIEFKMSQLTDVQWNLDKIQEQLKNGAYQSLDEDAFYYALRGLQERRVGAKVVTRVSDIETLRKQGIEFTVFDPLEKYDTPKALRDFLYKASGKHLDGDLLETFIDNLKVLPREDRLIMAFKPSETKLKLVDITRALTSENKPTISQVTETLQKMNVFGRVKDPKNDNQYVRLSASLELFDLVLRNRFKAERSVPNPVLGKSTPSQIEVNGLSSTRDVCHFYLVPDNSRSSQLTTYDQADGYKCVENDFNEHDRYHTFVTSSMGNESRVLSVSIARQLKEHSLKRQHSLSKQDYQAMRSLRWQLVDVDYPQHYIFERNLRTKGKKSRVFYEATVRLYQENPKRALISSLFGFLPISHDLLIASQTFNNPSALALEKEPAQKLLESISILKPFESKAALQETFGFINSHLPKDKEYTEAKQQHLTTIKKNIDFTLTRLKEQLDNPFQSNNEQLNLSKMIVTLESFSSVLESLSSEA